MNYIDGGGGGEGGVRAQAGAGRGGRRGVPAPDAGGLRVPLVRRREDVEDAGGGAGQATRPPRSDCRS